MAGDRLRVRLRVRPATSRTAVGGRYGDALAVAVTARPAGGKATEAALRAVADAFGVPRSAVRLVCGATSRDKTVDVTGPPEVLRARLRDLLTG
jgi:uncharacterized protein YggU (UPF0235/DUF167 family)